MDAASPADDDGPVAVCGILPSEEVDRRATRLPRVGTAVALEPVGDMSGMTKDSREEDALKPDDVAM